MADTKHEIQEPAQSWEEGFLRAFNAICQRFCVTQPVCRVPARKPPTGLRPKRQQRATQGLHTRVHARKPSTGQRPKQYRGCTPEFLPGNPQQVRDPCSTGAAHLSSCLETLHWSETQAGVTRGLNTSGDRSLLQTQGLYLVTERVAYGHGKVCAAAGCRIPEDL
ncbi:Hypothetical predicted protein [Pelobates cultripes]|uniref:Uncharacterized protein n=1 Tax=Pelobates cultripes TaxID=61616 RepID=A0AAD1RYZ2_PELCU|nr:Hypothetical predicted protein [Pelobates cultripes]